MEITTIIFQLTMGLVTVLLTIIGFFVRRLIKRVDFMETELQEHKETDLKTFATKEDSRLMAMDFKEFLGEIITPVNRKLESIEQHLRKK